MGAFLEYKKINGNDKNERRKNKSITRRQCKSK